MELNHSIERSKELRKQAISKYNIEDWDVLNDAILCIKWYIEHQNDLEDIKAEIMDMYPNYTDEKGYRMIRKSDVLNIIDKHIKSEATMSRSKNNQEELILRAALYCVDEMLHNNKDVISFDKSNDGIDGYVDITTVHNYLSAKINDLKHSRE